MRILVLALAAAALLVLTSASPAVALPPANLIVDRTDDVATATACTDAPDDCSLRGAVLHSNQSPGPEVIVLDADQTYDLSIPENPEEDGASGDLDFYSDAAVVARNGPNASIDAKGLDRIADIHSESPLPDISVLFRNVALTGGSITAGPDAGGGAIFSRYATVTLDKVLIFENTARYGGAILGLNADLSISRSTIRDNTSTSGGGTIYNNTGRLKIDSTTISGNDVSGTAGAIANFGGRITLTNSTLSGNTATLQGGAIYTNSNMTLKNVTIAQNASHGGGGGVYVEGEEDQFAPTSPQGGGSHIASIENTVIAGNTDSSVDPECSGAITSLGYNLIQDMTAGCELLGGTSTDILDTNAQLGNLFQSGLWTATHDPVAGSPLIDVVPPANCPSIDQRLMVRPAGALCDIGAVEANAVLPGTIAFSWGDLACNQAIDINDALPPLAFAAGVSSSLPASSNCPALPDMVYVEDPELQGFWGDINCDGLIDGQDALLILSFLAEIEGLDSLVCPGVGAEVTLLTVPH